MRSPLLRAATVAGLIALTGCATTGIPERHWNAGYAALKPGQTPAEVCLALGEPREIVPADPATEQWVTWIYSRPEPVGWRVAQTGDHDIPLPNGQGTVTVPQYEDQDVIKNVEYHLIWESHRLQQWHRIIPD
jgi:hypothetical protein